METLTKKIYLSGLFVFTFIQLGHTVFNKNTWPFCSYNMFNTIPPSKLKILTATVIDTQQKKQRVPVSHLLPIEFFRAKEILLSIFYFEKNKTLQNDFAKKILFRLNNKPWASFDETFSSVKPSKGSKFYHLSIEVDELIFQDNLITTTTLQKLFEINE